MYEAIQDIGAFQRFKDGIRGMVLKDNGIEFKENKIKELVIEWCKEQDIEIE